MDKDIKITIDKTKPKSKPGGSRAGAGRKDGSKNLITVQFLLQKLGEIQPGQGYEDLLIKDFMEARASNDKHLTYKYHQLILSKVMNSVARLEITDTTEQVEAKKLAFSKALERLITLKDE